MAILLAIIVVGGGSWWVYGETRGIVSPRGKVVESEPALLTQYDFDQLRQRGGKAGKIEFIGGVPEGVRIRRGKINYPFETKTFVFESGGKKISGMMNYYDDGDRRPMIIMIRGYADKAGYYVGSGSWRVADKLAGAGLQTASIDFLGFGESEGESLDMLEARFEKVPAVMDLIESVKGLPFVNGEKLGIWAHSNGGQIALSVLETTGYSMPTVLWAPMTNPFPQSVLDTASGLDDGGRTVIAAIEEFETKYDSRRYAFENYYEWVNGPVVIHQGTADEWCEVAWQEVVRDGLLAAGKEVKLYVYPGDDHNLSKNWEEVVEKDKEFYWKVLE